MAEPIETDPAAKAEAIDQSGKKAKAKTNADLSLRVASNYSP